MVPTLSPRQRVLAALHGEQPKEGVPFAPHMHNVPRSTDERLLRNRGMCLVKGFYQFACHTPHVNVTETRSESARGTMVTHRVYQTPVGEIAETLEDGGFTSWYLEHMFKGPEDYKAIRYLIEDAVITPDYAPAAKASATWGDDFLVRGELPYEPMQEIIYHFMDSVTFCYEWSDRRDEVLTLFNAMTGKNQKMIEASLQSPMEVFCYGGNFVPSLFGVDFFQKYYLPAYEEATHALHKHGKLVGCHFDSDNTLIMDDIAGTDLDFIEALDAGMGPSVADARKAWPGKVLWLNYPSAWHLLPPDEIRRRTQEMLRSVRPAQGLIVGITEDVPEDRWQANYAAIMDGIDDEAAQR